MKIILKIFKYLALTLVVVLLLLSGLSLVLQGRITRIFTSEVNRYTETGISVEKLGFSLIRGFPKATVEFKNLRMEAHPSSDPWIDSLLKDKYSLDAASVYASFDIRDIIHKQFTIDRLTLKNSDLILFSDDGGNNLNRLLKEEFRSDSSRVSFNLDNIRLENTGFMYLNNKKHFLVNARLDNTRGKLSHIKGSTEVEVKTGFTLNMLSSRDKNITRPLNGEIDGKLRVTSDSVYFNQLALLVDNQHIDIDGSLCLINRNISLGIASSSFTLESLKEKLYLPEGLPEDATVNNIKATINMEFDNAATSFHVDAESYNLEYAGSQYKGSFSLANLELPFIDFSLNSNIILSELFDSHPPAGIESLSGVAHVNARFTGPTGQGRDIGTGTLLELNRRINLYLSGVSLKLSNYNYPLENISGNIMLADNAWADELSLTIAGQNMLMNGIIENVAGLLNANTENIDIKAGIWADKFDKRLTTNDEGKDTERKTLNTNQLWDRINASLSLSLDSLIVDNFRASQFDGVLNYRPGFLNISSFSLLSLDGYLEGNAALARNSGGDYQGRAWIEIENADIHEGFKVFNNFKQDQLVAENIRGSLSGSLSLSSQLDQHFRLIPSTLSVTGSYSIYKGELIAFDPILKLSRFIEVSELEDIVFDDLHNDLLISDNRVIIPSMEINSSAFNISLSGEQDFSGDYNYHLRVLLSDILGKKARSSDSYINEFGTVEDDGLGRTNLFIKLERKAGVTKVSYDVKKLSEEIKENLKKEKQNLKTILNEEYGWYNADSLRGRQETSSRKFRITWEETDSVKTVVPEETVGKRGRTGILKKIFKADTTKKGF